MCFELSRSEKGGTDGKPNHSRPYADLLNAQNVVKSIRQ